MIYATERSRAAESIRQKFVSRLEGSPRSQMHENALQPREKMITLTVKWA